MGPDEEKHPQSTTSEDDLGTLSWKGQHGPLHPYNWSNSREWALTILAAFATFLTMMNGTMIAVAHFEYTERFHVDETSFPHSYWPITAWAAVLEFLSWRWIGYVQLIWFGALSPVYYLFFFESRGEANLAVRARGLEKRTEATLDTEQKPRSP
ncbi:hypothetical protein BJX70DRAFT_397956 [Aspergillus crustosus]